MRQILQNLGSGETELVEVPRPVRSGAGVLIKSSCSLVSLGTERMLVEFGRSGWIAKARSQPDKVKQVLAKIKTDGLFATLETVKAKLDTPIPLGYCNVGAIAEAPAGSHYRVGQRVVSNGPHAEYVAVSPNLVAPIPDGVSDEEAAFTVVGAIALQGIRLVAPTLGESVVVSGLGLIGLLAVQLLRANGCRVLGIDYDPKKLALARQYGAETCDLSQQQDPVLVAEHWTAGRGVDAVLITASTKSDTLIHQTAMMCRKRGRIVLVGVIGLNLQRADFYEKELTFQVSCSYGPGRYDPEYENRGLDYPIGFVRWTEQRNFEAILQLLADGQLSVSELITHRFAFSDALQAYQLIGNADAMGMLLEYSQPQPAMMQARAKFGQQVVAIKRVTEQTERRSVPVRGVEHSVGVAFIGAGGFSTRMLLPLLPKEGIRRVAIASRSGASAAHAARKFGFERTLGDYQAILDNRDVDAVFITTPHNLHANMVCEALQAGKHVFVEKPLALNQAELKAIESASAKHAGQCLMIGFNRRFSPHTRIIQQWSQAAPANKGIIITVNAGAIPANHWTQDRLVGGGRIVGEACHFVDLARCLIGAPIDAYSAMPLRGGEGRLGDCASLALQFRDGSQATIHYLSNGSKDYPKERIEVFAGGRVLVCDNFRKSYELGGGRRMRTRSQDKGHSGGLSAFLAAVRSGGDWPIPLEEQFEVSQVTLALDELITAECCG